MKKLCCKVLIFALSVLICLSSVVYAFSDVDMNSVDGKAILAMQERGYLQGFQDGTFRPEATLTRAEFVTVINRMYGYYVQTENIFWDVQKSDWFYEEVMAAVQAGYIKGMGDGRFAPNETVSREQVCVMLNSILKLEQVPELPKPQIADSVSDWARTSVETLVSYFIFELENDGRFRATEPITRAEACVALEKCMLSIAPEIEVPEIDLDSIAEEEIRKRLQEIIKCMNETIIPNLTFEETVKVANMLVESMESYLADPEFDYVTAAKETYEVYRKFNEVRAREFKGQIFEHLDVDELVVLFDFFNTPELSEIL